MGIDWRGLAPEELQVDVIRVLYDLDPELEVSQMDGKREHTTFRRPPKLRA
jgi:hypothetical protein